MALSLNEDLVLVAGAINVVAAGVMATAATLILRTNRHKTVNRVATASLLFLAAYVLSQGLMYSAPNPEAAHALLRANLLLVVPTYFVIPLFPSYFPRPRLLARHRRLLALFAVPLAFGWLAVAVDPRLFAGSFQRYYYGYDWLEAGPVGQLWLILQVGGAVYALATLTHSYRHAVSDIERNQARYALFAYAGPTIGGITYAALIATHFPPLPSPLPLLYAFAALPFFYGVLKYQLLDIDLKFKKGLRYSLLTAAVASLFVVGEQVMGLVLGGLLPGSGSYLPVVAAGGMTSILFGRLREFCSRTVDRLLPGVHSDPVYLERRRVELFRALLHEMLFRGAVDTTTLTRFAEQLGLTPELRQRLEEQVRREHNQLRIVGL